MKLDLHQTASAAGPSRQCWITRKALGVSGVEVNTCGWSTAPHFDLSTILRDKNAQKAFLRAFADRELEVVGLNANGNPLHPTDHGQGQGLEDTIRAAGELGIKTVCAMSGLPAGNAADTMPNWVVSSLAAGNAGYPSLPVGGEAPPLLDQDRGTSERARCGTHCAGTAWQSVRL